MALGERVMVLEGLRMSRMLRHAQAVGAGGAGGKGIASLSGYSSIDCDTCLSVSEYEALAAQRRRLANRAITMQASAWRRAAQGGREARMTAEDAVIAAAAAKALAANADAKAMIARQLQTAPPNVAHKLVAMVKELANRSAAILKSDRTEWLPGSGGYAAAVGPYSRPRKSLAGLSGAWVVGPDGKYVWDEGTATTQVFEGKAIEAGTFIPPGTTGIVDLSAQRSAQDAWLAGDYSGTGALEYVKADVTLNPSDQRTYDAAVAAGISPQSLLTGEYSSVERATDRLRLIAGDLPFKVTSTQQFYYARDRREIRVIKNDPTWIKRGLDAAAAAAEGLAKQAVCFAAKKAAAAAMAALNCGSAPSGATTTRTTYVYHFPSGPPATSEAPQPSDEPVQAGQHVPIVPGGNDAWAQMAQGLYVRRADIRMDEATRDCRAAAAAQAEILRRAGCTPPKEIEDAAGPPPSASKFGGAITIAIPALLAVMLLGGK